MPTSARNARTEWHRRIPVRTVITAVFRQFRNRPKFARGGGRFGRGDRVPDALRIRQIPVSTVPVTATPTLNDRECRGNLPRVASSSRTGRSPPRVVRDPSTDDRDCSAIRGSGGRSPTPFGNGVRPLRVDRVPATCGLNWRVPRHSQDTAARSFRNTAGRRASVVVGTRYRRGGSTRRGDGGSVVKAVDREFSLPRGRRVGSDRGRDRSRERSKTSVQARFSRIRL
ncbi:hypothetical protein CKA32_001478 [Geitlerinema sp. FC II]|nr:hypothetical protein CKA32_001478 [Geitlerinema sp. FC II]